jgi:hypothetical protein
MLLLKPQAQLTSSSSSSTEGLHQEGITKDSIWGAQPTFSDNTVDLIRSLKDLAFCRFSWGFCLQAEHDFYKNCAGLNLQEGESSREIRLYIHQLSKWLTQASQPQIPFNSFSLLINFSRNFSSPPITHLSKHNDNFKL